MDETLKNFIVKKKRGNFEINANGWLLKLDNSNLYIEKSNKNYTIDLKNLISISSNTNVYTVDHENVITAEKKYYEYYIKIKYLKNEKIKVIKLLYKQDIYKQDMFMNWKLEASNSYISDDVINSLLSFFLTNLDLENEEKKQDTDYVFIRSSDDNEQFQKIIQKTTQIDKKIGLVTISILKMVIVLVIVAAIIFVISGLLKK